MKYSILLYMKREKKEKWLEYLLAELKLLKRLTLIILYINNLDFIILLNNLKFFYYIKYINI